MSGAGPHYWFVYVMQNYIVTGTYPAAVAYSSDVRGREPIYVISKREVSPPSLNFDHDTAEVDAMQKLMHRMVLYSEVLAS